jgi:hypothetical protein
MLTLLVALTLSAAAQTSDPVLALGVGVGLPNLLGARGEVFVSDQATVVFGAGTGITPFAAEVGARWRPTALCAGCEGGHHTRLSLGLGGTLWVGVIGDTTALLLSADADLLLLQYLGDRGGLLARTRWGLGPTMDVPSDRFRVEPGLGIVLLELGAFL